MSTVTSFYVRPRVNSTCVIPRAAAGHLPCINKDTIFTSTTRGGCAKNFDMLWRHFIINKRTLEDRHIRTADAFLVVPCLLFSEGDLGTRLWPRQFFRERGRLFEEMWCVSVYPSFRCTERYSGDTLRYIEHLHLNEFSGKLPKRSLYRGIVNN